MNVLVSFFRGHPQAIPRLTEGERVSIAQLTDLLQHFELPQALDGRVIAALTRGPNGHLLDAYLGVVDVDHWEARLEAAEVKEAPDPAPLEVREWATFVSAQGSDRGLSLPDDSDPANLRVSLFARGTEALQRVSIEFRHGAGLPTDVSVSLAYGCSLPDWGDCYGDECSGQCERRRVAEDERGLVCICPKAQGEAMDMAKGVLPAERSAESAVERREPAELSS